MKNPLVFATATILFGASLQAQDVADPAPTQLEETVVESAPEPAPRPAPAPRTTPVAPPPAPEPVPVPAEPLVIDDSSALIPDLVGGLRTGTPIIDIPRSVTVFTEERIDDQGITSLGEIVDYTPGVNTSQGEGHRDSIVFRGQPRSTADFFVDGVRDDVQYYRGLYNIQQVEILRGPSALVFGRGGTGGIVNRVLKKPILGYDFKNFDTTVDTFGAALGQIDINQTLASRQTLVDGGKGGKQAIEDPTAALRFNGFYEYLDNHRDFYDGTRFGVNPTLAFLLGPDTRLDVSYEYNNFDRFIDRGIPTGSNGRPVSALTGTVFGDEDQNFTSFEAHVFRATLSHDFSDTWKGRLTASYGDYDKVYQNFYASGYDQSANEVTLDGYVDTTTRENFVISGDVVGEFETGFLGHKVLLGGEYVQTSSDQNRFNAFWDTTQDDNETFSASNFRLRNGSAINSDGVLATNSFSDLNDDTRVNIDVYSAFLQDEIAIGEKLDLVLGARFDQFEIEVNDLEPGGTGLRSRTDQEISPRAGLILKPIESISLYGSYSESFLPRSGEQFADINGDDNILDPNTFSNLEGGLKWDLRPGLSLRTAIFEIEQSSPQVSDADAATLDVIDTVTNGFEAELTGFLTDRWFVSAGYPYLDGEQVDRSGNTGLDPREVPEHAFSLWNRYQVTDRLGLGLGVIYQDSSFANNSNTAILPSYTRVDAAAYYKLNDNYRLQINVENLFDTEYFPNSHSTHQITVGRPIGASISIRGSF